MKRGTEVTTDVRCRRARGDRLVGRSRRVPYRQAGQHLVLVLRSDHNLLDLPTNNHAGAGPGRRARPVTAVIG
jgi:hypothetical protein